MEASTNTTTRTSAPTSKRPLKRSQIACVRCNRRRAKCNAATIGLPCSACAELGLTDCQFIQSKRKWNKSMRQLSSSNLDEVAGPTREDGGPLSVSPQSEEGECPPDETNKAHNNGSVVGSGIAVPSESNESETWTKAADVISIGNLAGDVSVSYLGGTWVIPAAQMLMDLNLRGVCRALSVPLTPGFCMEMLSSFFDKFHTIFPIVDQPDFKESLRAKTLPRLLLDTILLAGVTHCNAEILRKHGFATRMEAIQYFYDRASAGFDTSRNTETLVLIQCMFIMQFYWMNPRDWKDTKFWLSTAIRQAQFLGLHKKAEIHKLKLSKQRLCRRIWWCLYIRDRQCASATGLPIMIQDEDCDLEYPSLEDMDDNMSLEAKLAFLQLVKLMREVRSLLRAEFGLASTLSDRDRKEHSRQEVTSAYETWQAEIPTELKTPSKGSGIAVFYLHITFHTQIVILNRSIAHRHYSSLPIIDVNSLVSNHAAHMITILTNQLSTIWGTESLLFHCCYSIFAAITVQLVVKKEIPELSMDSDFAMNMKSLRLLGDFYPIAAWIEKLIDRVIDERNDGGESSASKPFAETPRRPGPSSKGGSSRFHMRSPRNHFQESQTNFSSMPTVMQFGDQPPTSHEAEFESNMYNSLLNPPVNSGWSIGITEREHIEDYLAASSMNCLDQDQDDLDGWQAAYNQLELDKLF